MGLSAKIQQTILKSITGKNLNSTTSDLIFRSFYVGLCTEKPNATDTVVASELPVGSTGIGYHRQYLAVQQSKSGGYEMNPLGDKISDPTLEDGNYVSKNTQPIMFPKCDAESGWGPVKYAIFFSAETGGTFIGWGKLKEPKLIEKDQVATFDVGELKLTFIDEDESETVEEPSEPGSGDEPAGNNTGN